MKKGEHNYFYAGRLVDKLDPTQLGRTAAGPNAKKIDREDYRICVYASKCIAGRICTETCKLKALAKNFTCEQDKDDTLY